MKIKKEFEGKDGAIFYVHEKMILKGGPWPGTLKHIVPDGPVLSWFLKFRMFREPFGKILAGITQPRSAKKPPDFARPN